MNEEESKVSFDERFKTFTHNVGQYASGIIAVAVAIWWVFYGTVEIVPTPLTITQRIGLAFATSILALSYCKLISHGGFKSAKSTSSYRTQTEEWSACINKCIHEKAAVNKYAKEEAISNLKMVRRQNLENNELLYKEWFDEKGYFIGKGYWKRKDLTRHQKKIIRKCLHLKLAMPNLFGAASSKMFGLKKEEEQKKYEFKTDMVNAVVRITLTTVSVGMMFNFLGFSVGSMVFALFQIVLWTASGFSQRMKNYDWVINVALPQIVEKKLILTAWLQLPPEVKEKYLDKSKEEHIIEVAQESSSLP